MTVTDHVLSAIKSTSLKTPRNIHIKKKVPKYFLPQLVFAANSIAKKTGREPVRQFIIAMNTNNAFLGTNRTKPFA